MRLLLFLLLGILTAGCATLNDSATTAHQQQACGEPKDADTAVRLDLTREMMQQGRLYAALAHLDDLNSDALQATYLRAEILRQSDRAIEAKNHYQTLLTTCMNGEGHHGLGLIAGRNGQLNNAVMELGEAARLRPVNARIRNDYGYALLLKGDFKTARHEFLTAMELDEDARLAETNMVILLYLSGDPQRAQRFAQRIDMDKKTLTELQAQAGQMAKTIPAAARH